MHTLLRITMLGVFASAGIAMAIGVAFSTPEEPAALAEQPQADQTDRGAAPEVAAVQPRIPFADDSLQLQPPLRAEPPVTQNQGGNIPVNLNPTSLGEIFQMIGPLLQQASNAQANNALAQAQLNSLTQNANQLQSGPPREPNAPQAQNTQTIEPRTVIRKPTGEGDDSLSITIQGEDIRKVLELLSEQGGLNILASRSVTGLVSASLLHVDIETALDAILKSTGYVWRRDGQFIFVGTPADFLEMNRSVDVVSTRLYRLNYLRASELQALVTPLLTPETGSMSVTTEAEAGIQTNGDAVGGNSYAGQEAVLVRDYEAVLLEIDQVVAQMDRRPTQVQIEAMILSVKLDDSTDVGVDFEVLRQQSNLRLTSGDPTTNLAQLDLSEGGLKIGYLDSNLSVLVSALETIGETNVIATPRLMCLNKHRAEILIGSQLGYVSTTQTETSTTQSVEFLEVGTQLRLRPFISSDGMIRMEVHPELSTGNVRTEGGFTLPDKEVTQVTTNIMVRDGCTVVIGGLMRDEISSSGSQIPLLGSLPVIGPAFRNRSETTDRNEVLVLITPRIVNEPQTCCEGDRLATEFHHRQAVAADQMMPLGTRYLGRKYFRLAQQAWAGGYQSEALRLINLSIHFDPLSRASIDLRADIVNGQSRGDHTYDTSPPGGSSAVHEEVPAWANGGSGAVHPVDPGRPGGHVNIQGRR